MKKAESKNSPLYVELPRDLRQWLEQSRKREGFTIKEKTIRIFKQARQLDRAREIDIEVSL